MSNKRKPIRYRLVAKNETSESAERIVVAGSRSQALSHVANTEWTCEPLKIEDAIRLTREGVTEEFATADLDQLPLPGIPGAGADQ